ncbi:armadillo-type protein [Entophlyctis helioformis]|nr:armadillo-type protein [Entophlyctis helioformis]
MDVHALYSTLAATVQPDAAVRSQGEATLKQIESHAGLLPALLQIVAVPESDAAVKQAAAIYFKNRVGRLWDPSREQSLNQDDRLFVKTHIIEAISKADSRIRSQMLASLTTIITFEFRHGATWPELVPTVKTMLASDQRHIVFSGLLVFLELVKNYQWAAVSERTALHPVLEEILPITLSIANNLKAHAATSLEATEMLKCIIKTYNCSIRLEIAQHQQDLASLVPWGTLFVEVAEMQIAPSALNMPEDAEDREKHMWWKLKKWSYQCLNTLFGRYACTKPEKRYKNFSKMFVATFAPKILESFLKQISLAVQGVWMSARVKQHLATFLEHCVKRKTTWAMLKEHLSPVISDFIFPLMCFSQEDDELWHENPVDYIHKKIDPPMDDFKSPVVAVAALLQSICKDRFEQAFMPTVGIINAILGRYNEAPADKKDPRHKYGVLNMMTVLVEQALDERSPIRNDMETSTYPFLRARACDTLLKFASEMDFQVMNAVKDPELPVRVEAALALSPFLRYPKIHDAMKPHAAPVMQELMNLTNEIDMDTLTHVMEQLVFEYSEELTPFAVQLATQLRDTFMRIMSDANYTADDFDSMAAMGVLKTISSLVLSVEGSVAIVHEVEAVIVPAIVFVLENGVLDLYEEVFEIIETSTFSSKAVSPLMWSVLPYIYRTFKADAFDYFEEMTPSLHNYIMHGKDVLAASAEHQEMIFDMATTVLTAEDARQSDRAYAHLVLKPAKSVALRVHAIEIVVNALFYNPALALGVLEQAQYTTAFFETWFKQLDDFERVHDKRLSILTLAALLELPTEALPPALQSNWTYLFGGILRLFNNYSEVLEERLKEQRIANGEEEDDDEEVEDDDFYSSMRRDDDVSDDEEEPFGEKLEALAGAAAAETTHTFDDEDEDDDNYSVEGMMIEDIYFTTYLDEVDVHVQFESLMESLAVSGRSAVLESTLSPEQTAFVGKLLKTAAENRAKAATAAASASASAATAAQ